MSKKVVLLFALVFLSSTLIMAESVSAVDLGSWTTRASMQEARSELGVVVANGKIYAVGGSTKQGEEPYTGGIVGTNEEYDPATNTWVFKTPMPTPRIDFGIAVYNNKIYCVGGKDGESITNVNEVYYPATDTWETKEPMPTPRYGMRANVVNGKIYLVGGDDPDVSIDWGASTHNEVYDPETDSWSTKTPVPHPTTRYASAVFDDKIYVIGGYIGRGSARDGAEGLHFDLNQVYDTETDSWSYGAPLTEGYGSVAGAVTTGLNAPMRIYVIGEMRLNFGDDTDYFVRVYDPVGDNWVSGANIPTDRANFGVAVLDDMLYVIGGGTAYLNGFNIGDPITLKKYATNERYTPIGYGTVSPIVSLVSPQNQTYNASNVSLVFAVSKPVSWIGYSLDGQDNVTVTGNSTLSELTNGFHNITVYARDEFENTGTSKTITFTINEETESIPFPTTLVLASVITVGAVGIGLLVYFKKRKH